MMRSRFSESQMAAILNEGKAGILVVELYHMHNNATYYHWKSRYSDVQVSERQRLLELEAKNAKLKSM